MIADNLLSEVQRQQKYLEKLPSDFQFPLFNARHALESQRRSGYRDTASASREIVDNAFEAGADRVHVVLHTRREGKKRELVDEIAFIDNGSGMIPQMARYALTWGGGTHFDEPGRIGRFGYGLPNASINQTRLVDVYTRVSPEEKFTRARLDLNEFSDYGVQTIGEPVEAELPGFVEAYLERTAFNLDHGTVVVWVNPDRLTYKTPATLKEHLVDDFGVTYRYLLADSNRSLELKVENVEVKAVDPLFLLPEGRFYLPEDKGGAQQMENRFVTVKYSENADTGERHLQRVDDLSEVNPDDPQLLAAGTIYVRVARLPVGFAEHKRSRREETTDANRRFDIRKPRRGMSFVRAGREIQTLDAFPKSSRDTASGMGEWPLLQSYAYHWGVEVKFDPELDEVFGITNDKQGVRPIEDFWRVLHEAEIDAALHRENNWQVKTREELKKQRKLAEAAASSSPDTPSPAEKAAQDADVAGSSKPSVPAAELPTATENQEKEAQRRAQISGETLDAMRDAMEKEAKRRPYRIDYFDAEDDAFFKPDWVGSQIVIAINRRHPFYEVLYAPLLELPDGQQVKEAVDVLLIALGKAELLASNGDGDDEMVRWYRAQRKKCWSGYLEDALTSLHQHFQNLDGSTPEELIHEVALDEEPTREPEFAVAA